MGQRRLVLKRLTVDDYDFDDPESYKIYCNGELIYPPTGKNPDKAIIRADTEEGFVEYHPLDKTGSAIVRQDGYFEIRRLEGRVTIYRYVADDY